MNQNIIKTIDFVSKIGLIIHNQTDISSESFVPHIHIENGEIYVNPNLVTVSDLLHECAHLALIPKTYRIYFTGNLYKGFEKYLSQITEIDSISYYLMQASDDDGSTAWAWAVGKLLNISEEDIIDDSSYDHSGEYVRNELRNGWHSGISGLHYANYTSKRGVSLLNPGSKKAVFPEMDFWTADDVLNHFNADSMAFS